MPTIAVTTRHRKLLPWQHPNGTVIPDACLDSHGHRLARAQHGFPALARFLATCFDPVTGELDVCSLLFEYLDMPDGNPRLPESIRAIREDLGELTALLQQSGGQNVSMLLNIERKAGGRRTLHSHGQAPGWLRQLISQYLGEGAVFTSSSGRRVKIGSVKPLHGKHIGDYWVYMSKLADATGIRWHGRSETDFRAGQLDSVKRYEEACDARRTEGLYRLLSTRIKIGLPMLPRLSDRQLRALRRVLKGSAPAIPAPDFLAYLDAVANWAEARVQLLLITLLALVLTLAGHSQHRADEVFMRTPSDSPARSGQRVTAHQRRVARAREPP